jgi:aminoglycoside phosphotransferase (APT) family kinase protein
LAIRLDRDYDANVAGLASFSEEGAVYRVDRLTGAPSVLHVFSRSRPLDRVGATPPSWRIWNAAAFPGDLPHTLIHNDCHPANALRAASGDVVFFDWEGAGQGPRIAALGLLLYSCSVQAPDEPPMPSDLERVDAVIGGYASRRALTHAEVQCLPDAVQVRPVVVAMSRRIQASL